MTDCTLNVEQFSFMTNGYDIQAVSLIANVEGFMGKVFGCVDGWI